MIIFCLILWFVFGVLSHIYWWTKIFNYTINDIFFSLCCGVLGPISYIIGFLSPRDYNINKVLIKRRRLSK